MMTHKNFSNFDFLRDINQPLYAAIVRAESLSRIDFIDCGHKSRQACEIFINSVLKDKGLDGKISGDLFTKISTLQDETLLKQSGYLKGSQSLSAKPILPDIGSVDFVSNSGKTNLDCNYYDFLRRFGNACSHPEQKPYDPKINFSNVVKCLQGYMLLFYNYYSSQISEDEDLFDADSMPIGQFYIDRSFAPNDKSRSKCKREFWGHSLDTRQNIAYYVILRLYDKNDVNNNFLLRNSDVFTEASREAISGIPEGMTSFQTIAGLDNTASSFYITAHLFRYEPLPLSSELLKNISIQQRVRLCLDIASCFNNLHNASEPIYHRMLTYDSIVVCNFKNVLIPYVIKFDYGKMSDEDQYKTVFKETKRAEQYILKDQSLTKYLAPEWNTISDSSTVDWSKIDIYSLGVLFSDILAGRFDSNLISFEELEDLDLSDNLLDTIDMMTSESISARSSIESVQRVFQEELLRWK